MTLSPEKQAAMVQYLHHSGFAVTTKNCFFLFDFDGTPTLDRILSTEHTDKRRLFAFVSHRHGDHYSPSLLEWKHKFPQMNLIFSHDVPSAGDVQYMQAGQTLEADGILVNALESTDEGVAFLVKANGLTIFHAGDLNWWHWNSEADAENRFMADRYQKEIRKLKGEVIDLAFVPVDPRQGNAYFWGLDFFMRTVNAAQVYPMHFWDDYSIFQSLMKNPAALPYKSQIQIIKQAGQCFTYSQEPSVV